MDKLKLSYTVGNTITSGSGQFLRKLNIYLLYDLTISLGIYPHFRVY